jgi:predicted permease
MKALTQDLRFAVRLLAKSPAFTAVVVLTLGLGIGANTALFSIVNGVLLNPLPYPQPDRLITLHESKPNFETGSISYPNFLDWQRDNHTFSAMAVTRSASFNLTGLGDAEEVGAQFVTSDFFPLLDTKPMMGRAFVGADDQIGAAPVAMISGGFWKRKLGSAPGVVGKSLTLDGRGYTIVGVIPSDFHFTLGSFSPSEIYVPVVQWSNNLLFNRGAGLGFHGLGRLKPGVTIDQARADLAGISRNLAIAYPDTDKGIGATLIPLRERMLGGVQSTLMVLSCAVGFVLLIACANIANLFLARSHRRAREFAVRAALGAGKSRLVQQILSESALFGLMGGALGLFCAKEGTRAALAALPATLPRQDEIGIDLHVLIFCAAVSLLAGVLFGLIPAFQLSRSDLQDRLKEGQRGAAGSRHHAPGALVIVETALALVLLIGAGLVLRSLVQLWKIDPGFRPDNVLAFGVSLSPSMKQASPAEVRAAFRALDSTISSVPGVHSVSMSWGALPMAGDDEWLFWREGRPVPKNQNDWNWAIDYVVDPDYLRLMGTPLLRGRFFTPQDDDHSPPVVVIDDVLARQYFPNEDPVGKRIFLSIGQPGDIRSGAEIIGIVGHVRQWGLNIDDPDHLRPELYFPFMQLPDNPMTHASFGVAGVVLTQRPAPGIFDSILHSVQRANRENVLYGAQSMTEIVGASIARQRFATLLLGAFAGVALFLACTGVYGVISYLVGQRTHEIGIRMALGAQQRDVLRQILGEGARMALAGVAVGLLGALALTRLMASVLYGVSATDPLTFAVVAALLALVVLLACFFPARRATRVDPMVALRHE